MNYTVIDLNKWERGELFQLYISSMRIVMSLTADIDVTPLLAFSKKNGLKFYPVMLWVVSRVINAHEEFKYGWDSAGRLIRWDFVSPSHTDFHREDERFTKYVTEYCGSLTEFYARVASDREKYKDVRGMAQGQPSNFFDVSCLPWVKYRNFDLHVFDEGKFLAPVVTWGRHETQGERSVLPLTMNIHHAVADGFHLSRFFLEVQEQIDALPSQHIY